eukprot:SAG11_NODE_34605_length_271_cov_0.593023_1_plen_33_part_01
MFFNTGIHWIGTMLNLLLYPELNLVPVHDFSIR